MDALAFLQKHGKDTAEKVALAAGTNYAYFSQIAYGHRRPGVDLAHELVRSSERHIRKPDERLDFESLLSPAEKSRRKKAA